MKIRRLWDHLFFINGNPILSCPTTITELNILVKDKKTMEQDKYMLTQLCRMNKKESSELQEIQPTYIYQKQHPSWKKCTSIWYDQTTQTSHQEKAIKLVPVIFSWPQCVNCRKGKQQLLRKRLKKQLGNWFIDSRGFAGCRSDSLQSLRLH